MSSRINQEAFVEEKKKRQRLARRQTLFLKTLESLYGSAPALLELDLGSKSAIVILYNKK